MLPVGQEIKQKGRVELISSAHLTSFGCPSVPSSVLGAERRVHQPSAGLSCIWLLPPILNVSLINP